MRTDKHPLFVHELHVSPLMASEPVHRDLPEDKVWSGSSLEASSAKSPTFYITVYAIVTALGLAVGAMRWFVLCTSQLYVFKAQEPYLI